MRPSKYTHAKMAAILAIVFLLGAVPLNAQGGTWQTGLMFMNLASGEGENATLQVDLYDTAGAVVATLMRTDILPLSGVSIYVPGESTVPYGQFAGVVSSDRPVAAVVNNVNRDLRAGDSYLGTRDVNVSTTVYAPLIYRNHVGYNSTLYIQNAHNSLQTISVSLTPNGGSTLPPVAYDVPAYASVEVPLSDSAFDLFGPTGYGSATIQGSDGPVAVVVSYFRDKVGGTADNMVGQYHGLARESAAQELYAPLVFKQHSDWNTGLQVVNVTEFAATVTVELSASQQSAYPGTQVTLSKPVDGNSSVNFYLPDFAEIPAPGFFGGAKITSTQDILVIANNAKYPVGDAVGSCYAPVTNAAATDRVAGPLVYRNWGDADTGISVQNLGATPTNMHLTVKVSNIAGLVYEFDVNDVPAGGAGTFELAKLLPADPGLYGSATISSSDGSPLAAVFNAPAYARGQSSNYVGINITN